MLWFKIDKELFRIFQNNILRIKENYTKEDLMVKYIKGMYQRNIQLNSWRLLYESFMRTRYWGDYWMIFSSLNYQRDLTNTFKGNTRMQFPKLFSGMFFLDQIWKGKCKVNMWREDAQTIFDIRKYLVDSNVKETPNLLE